MLTKFEVVLEEAILPYYKPDSHEIDNFFKDCVDFVCSEKPYENEETKTIKYYQSPEDKAPICGRLQNGLPQNCKDCWQDFPGT